MSFYFWVNVPRYKCDQAVNEQTKSFLCTACVKHAFFEPPDRCVGEPFLKASFLLLTTELTEFEFRRHVVVCAKRIRCARREYMNHSTMSVCGIESQQLFKYMVTDAQRGE